ncbi:MAG: BMP family ABC transporter substrate-binding protein, partial [Christensenellaceae bacterium]
VEFCHATGVTAASSGLDNFHNAFASIYEGRYLAGVVAGMKLNEMIEEGEFTEEEAKIGYVGAYTYAEVISGYTSFYLGAKSVCPTVTMDVQFTGSWFDISAEKSTAESLIAGGCKLISQHADSMGAPSACEEAGVPNVSYNGSTFEACPETFLVSSYIDWTPYFKYILEKAMTGEEIADDWTGTLETGSVKITEFGTAIADGTEEKVVEVEKSLLDGTLNVFDTSKFTVNGETLTSYMVDIDGDGEKEIEAIKDGVFQESIFRTAPYFDIKIDGIKLLTEKV